MKRTVELRNEKFNRKFEICVKFMSRIHYIEMLHDVKNEFIKSIT